MLEWDGYQWTTLATVADLAAARRFLNPQTADDARPTPPARSPMAAGTGRHRKTPRRRIRHTNLLPSPTTNTIDAETPAGPNRVHGVAPHSRARDNR
ncbi:DUF6087 family protein [Streptomyces sp. Mg1]|uniref:DUF6087 family protein n=1 Tax=Streptomyces sp. Mg1 TaxID=465541 RepID=UPI003FA6AB4C